MLVADIGCNSKIMDYIGVNSFDSLHGRSIATAVGVKLANPDLNVVVHAGDGATFAEGLEHTLFAAKRNVDITLIVHDNGVYGLTDRPGRSGDAGRVPGPVDSLRERRGPVQSARAAVRRRGDLPGARLLARHPAAQAPVRGGDRAPRLQRRRHAAGVRDVPQHVRAPTTSASTSSTATTRATRSRRGRRSASGTTARTGRSRWARSACATGRSSASSSWSTGAAARHGRRRWRRRSRTSRSAGRRGRALAHSCARRCSWSKLRISMSSWSPLMRMTCGALEAVERAAERLRHGAETRRQLALADRQPDDARHVARALVAAGARRLELLVGARQQVPGEARGHGQQQLLHAAVEQPEQVRHRREQVHGELRLGEQERQRLLLVEPVQPALRQRLGARRIRRRGRAPPRRTSGRARRGAPWPCARRGAA